MEREIRLEKVFDILDKISYLEEEVLIFIYINFLKYGNKTQCIKMFEKIYNLLDIRINFLWFYYVFN